MNIEEFWETVQQEDKKEPDHVKLKLSKKEVDILWGYIEMANETKVLKQFKKLCGKTKFQKILDRIGLTKKELRSLLFFYYKKWREKPDQVMTTS